MKLGTKYTARSTVKKLQLTSLDVNQISFKIYDTTWKSSLHKRVSSFSVLGSNQSNLFKQSKKKKKKQLHNSSLGGRQLFLLQLLLWPALVTLI